MVDSPFFGFFDAGPVSMPDAAAAGGEATAVETRARHDTVGLIGAGPAGLACAITLARAGRSVVVHEARSQVGLRFHDDFQGLENWSSSEDAITEIERQGIAPSFDYHPVYRGTAFDAWGEAYEIASERPIYYLVRRGPDSGTLDRGLLAQALELGIGVHFNKRAHAAAGTAIFAGGPRQADAIAVGYVFETPMADANYIWFCEAMAPLGYAYLLVHQGHGTVATCLFTQFKDEAAYLAKVVAALRGRVGLVMTNPRRFGGYVNFRLPRSAVQGGHPVVGEHAGFQDALAGFGMRYALRSGVLAARSLIERIDYQTLWRRELLPQLRASVVNRFLFSLAGDHGRRWMVRRLAKGDVRAPLHALYQPSLAKRLVFPIAAWRYRGPLRDPSCDHMNCGCVWCRHGLEAAPGPDACAPA